MSFDGTDWKWIDDTAYYGSANDHWPPESTALDHYVRNQQFHLGKMPHTYTTPVGMSPEVGLPYLRTSLRWTAIGYAPIVLWGQTNTLTFRYLYEVTDLQVNLAPFLVDPSGNLTFGDTTDPATTDRNWTEEVITGIQDATGGSGGVALVGIAQESPAPSTTELVTLSGQPSSAVPASSPSETGDHVGLHNDNRPGEGGKLLAYSSNGFEHTNDAENVAYTPAFNSTTPPEREYVWGPLEGTRLYSWSVEQNADYEPYGNEQIRPNITPRFDRGAGQHYRVARDLCRRPRLIDTNFQKFKNKPNPNWARRPQWRWVDGGSSEGVVSYFLPNNVNSPESELSFVWMAALVDQTRTSPTLEGADTSITSDVSITIDMLNFDATTNYKSTTQTYSLPTYPLVSSGSSPLMQHIFLQMNYTQSSDAWVTQEGQLYLDRFADDVADYEAIQFIQIPFQMPDTSLDQDRLHAFQKTFDLTNLSSDKRLYIFGHSVTEYPLTPPDTT